jgi:hypothetical protein
MIKRCWIPSLGGPCSLTTRSSKLRPRNWWNQLFADPSLTFQVAAQATLRERMKGLPGLFKFQQQIEAELFSEKRIKEASTGELGHLWKTVREAIAADVEMTQQGTRMERPRFDKPRPVNRRTTLQLIAKPEGEHHNGNG